jgi:hypothetical protein
MGSLNTFHALTGGSAMHLLHTNVASTTQGTVTVEFHGEGNELVSVRMSTNGNLDDQTALLRAKELMVQLTAFGDEGIANSDDRGEGLSIDETLAAEVKAG